jgi:hypothetical protein
MRTTLQIDDDILQAARVLAAQQKRSIGKVLSDLARRGLAPRTIFAKRHGFPTFPVSRDARPVTGEMVRRALEES